MNRATILNKVYTMQADTVANAYAALAAENERLRKAGDALQKGWIKDIRQAAAGRMTIKTIEDCFPAIAAWNAAKEGAAK